METGMNALRKHIGREDLCDSLITDALNKGPKRVRIASREELKIEINKYKNVSLRLMEEMKRNGIKPPGYALKAGLDKPETGLREEANTKEKTAMDHLDTMSEAQSHMSLGGDLDEGEATEAQLINEKHRL
jgi:chromosome segregation ATPase